MTQVSNDRAVIELAKLIMSLDDSCPDIGWGKSWQTAIEEALAKLDLTATDITPAVAAVRRRR